MRPTRRGFLLSASGLVIGLLDAAARERLCSARGLFTDPALDEIVRRTLAAAKRAGASYADLRVVRRRGETIHTREDRVLAVNYSESYGVGVRVIVDGAWGFAATSRVEPKEAERVARLAVDIARENAKVVRRKVALAPVPANVDVWQTPLHKDPFKLQPADKAELLLSINREALKVPGVKFCHAMFVAQGEWKLFASTDGCYIEQDLTRVMPGYTVTAVDGKGEFVTRRHDLAPSQGGWEYVERADLVAGARRIAEDAVEKVKAPSVTPGARDLILAPSNLWLTIHESVGHPTELDRAVGYEANFAGTSFATVDKLGKLSYAAPHVTLYADRTTPGALATCGYDDDGVKTGRWDIVKDGRFVGYQTTREQAGWIGERESRGTSYAQDYKSFPFQRMPNVSLQPGGKDLGVADLIAATDDGIYVTGDGSWSIDHQRYNFQFGGQMFYEIKKGKITGALKDVAYQSNTLDFWHACDLLGGAREWRLGGSLSDGKGEPSQSNAVSHGCPPARFRRVNILNTSTRGAARGGAEMAADATTLAQARAGKLLTDVLALCKKIAPAAEARATLTTGRSANTRFARSEITSTGDVDETELELQLAFGRRVARVSTNQMDPASLRAAIERAGRMAQIAPESPEHLPALGPQRYLQAPAAFDPATERLSAATRAAAARATIDAAGAAAGTARMEVAGFYEHGSELQALGTSAGLRAYHAETRAGFTTTARTDDGTGSGWAGAESSRAADIDAAALARVAIDKAARSRKPQRLAPGRYTVILEPAAVGDLLTFLVGAMDARAADEGRSFFSRPGGGTRLGEKLWGEHITLRSDPTDALTPAVTFSREGVPHRRVTWIDKGAAAALTYSRYWAQKQGREPLPTPSAVHLLGGAAADPAALLSGVKRGVLITRFWYTRMVDPQTVLVTGLTRDGVFLVEDGAVVGPVNNFRFNESPVTMLQRADSLTRGTVRVPSGMLVRVPGLRTHEFNLASVSDAV